MTTKKLTKLLALYLPYLLLGLVATNFGEAWRLAEGKELGDKVMSIKEKRLWNSLTLLSKFFRLWLSLWVLASACGVPSTCWKVTVTTTVRCVPD